MRCRDVQDLASSYIDGQLDDARASALRGHVRQCPSCLAAVRELGAMRDAAADLDTLEPPPSLWSAVQHGLAEAEIADARRSRLWLHWQALRPRLLPAAVALAAIATVTTWLWRRPPAPAPASQMVAELAGVPAVPGAAPASASPPRAVPDQAETFEAGRARELAEADQRYAQTLAELRGLVADERASWPAGTAARLDARLAALADEARLQLATNAAVPGATGHTNGDAPGDTIDVRSRDAVYAVYRAEIELLQNVALYGPEALNDAWNDASNEEGRP
jgi:anti-sigma factor RsiW